VRATSVRPAEQLRKATLFIPFFGDYNHTEPEYNLPEPDYNLPEPDYNLTEPGYNLPEPVPLLKSQKWLS
jgi:hypothetical protein